MIFYLNSKNCKNVLQRAVQMKDDIKDKTRGQEGERVNLNTEIRIELQDTQWKFDYINHDRNIARAIVYDENGQFYFVRAKRDDDFGKSTLIETAGGGVEEGEDLLDAIKRELKEELGVKVSIICKIGVVSDYYNLIHRHNINNYFLCKSGIVWR